MQTAARVVVAARDAQGLRRVVLRLLVVAFLAIVAYGALTALREAERLDDRRSSVLATRADPAAAAGDAVDAFRVFRQALSGSSRFALVFGADVDRDERGFFRLFAGSYLYPAVAVGDPGDADAVMVVGRPTQALLESFERLDDRNGLWLGKRRLP